MTDVVDVALTQARPFKVLPSLLNLFDTKLAQLRRPRMQTPWRNSTTSR